MHIITSVTLLQLLCVHANLTIHILVERKSLLTHYYLKQKAKVDIDTGKAETVDDVTVKEKWNNLECTAHYLCNNHTG